MRHGAHEAETARGDRQQLEAGSGKLKFAAPDRPRQTAPKPITRRLSPIARDDWLKRPPRAPCNQSYRIESRRVSALQAGTRSSVAPSFRAACPAICMPRAGDPLALTPASQRRQLSPDRESTAAGDAEPQRRHNSHRPLSASTPVGSSRRISRARAAAPRPQSNLKHRWNGSRCDLKRQPPEGSTPSTSNFKVGHNLASVDEWLQLDEI